MRKLGLLVLTAFFVFGCFGCATMGKIGRGIIGGPYVPIPSPQPGLVLPIARSPGVWAECYLFEGRFREKELFIPHPTERGKLTFPLAPIKHFTIDPPPSDDIAYTVPLLLSVTPADYTLLVFYENMKGWVVEMETICFSTTGNFKNDEYRFWDRKVYADQIIRLARVRPYENKQFRINRTFYPGHAIKDLLGLP